MITSDSDWKYVNVRRLLIFIEGSIDLGLQWVVFEPNAEPLWARVKRTISNFLTLVWRNGALEGTKPEEAYFVKCDRTTMTQTDIDNGRLIVVIGVAPVKPAEFVIIRIGLWTAHARGLSRRKTEPCLQANAPIRFEHLISGSRSMALPWRSFREASGLTAEGDSVDYREGTDLRIQLRKLIGLRKFSEHHSQARIHAKQRTVDRYANIVNGLPDRRNFSIILMDEQRQRRAALGCEKRLDQQDRRSQLQRERQ